MRPLLAILLALVTLLSHSGLLAVATSPLPECAGMHECRAGCACCQKESCCCAEKSTPAFPVPQPAAPLRGSEFHPVAALPPQPANVVPGVLSTDLAKAAVELVASRIVHPKAVRLFVRHCAYLL